MNGHDLLARCLVQIHTEDGFGTGFFVSESTVLTCAHVVAGQDDVRLRWDGADLAGTVVRRHPDERGAGKYHGVPDLAVIRLTDPVEHPCVWLADPSARLVDGARVSAYGFSRNTLAAPDIGRDVRTLTVGGLLEDDVVRVQRDNLPRGMSGSPVVDPETHRVAGLVKASVDHGAVLPPAVGSSPSPR